MLSCNEGSRAAQSIVLVPHPADEPFCRSTNMSARSLVRSPADVLKELNQLARVAGHAGSTPMMDQITPPYIKRDVKLLFHPPCTSSSYDTEIGQFARSQLRKERKKRNGRASPGPDLGSHPAA